MQSVRPLVVVRAAALPRLRSASNGPMVFVASFASYVTAALVLVLHYHVVAPEALSRVANGYYVLYSRDPHLAAVGFVLDPLPSLLALPLLPLKFLEPDLVRLGLAGSFVSAAFMAGTVYLTNRLLLEFRVARWPRLLLTILFGLNPIVLYLGGSGLPQAVLLFFLLWAVVGLARWWHGARVAALIGAGIALAAAYLVTPSALAAVGGAIVLVFYRSWQVAPRGTPYRRLIAVSDVLLLIAPVILAVGTWVGATWVITGDAFHQFSSTYALGSQIQALGTGGAPFSDTLARLLALEPGIVGLAGLAALGMLSRNDGRVVSGAVVLVPFVVTEFAGQLIGIVQPSLLSLAAVITLTVVLAAAASAPSWPAIQRLIVVLLVGASLPTGAAALAGAGILRTHAESFPGAVAAAVFLDSRHLAAGSVLIDTYSGYPVVLASENPHQFVITNDRDFRLALTDPGGSGVQYFLVPAPANPVTVASLDALTRAYPGAYQSGGEIGTLVQEFDGPGGVQGWRLYRVVGG